MVTVQDFEKAVPAEKIRMVCEVFSVHSVLHFFGRPHLQSKTLSMVAKDNLEECLTKAKHLIQNRGFMDVIGALSGKDAATIGTAFNGQNRQALANAILKRMPEVEFTLSQDLNNNLEHASIDFSGVKI